MNQIRRELLKELPDARVLARAPGRVNLIGEHIDYSGFPVLPLAIAESVQVAVAPRRDGLLHIRNLDRQYYPEELICVPDVVERPRRGFWSDYVIAAARAVPLGEGAEIVVGSDLPVAAGLSSSAALVVASLLALRPQRDGDESGGADLELAELACAAERYVGTQTGGMDQAVAVLGQESHALRIGFRPLRATPVSLPPNLSLVVVDSGIVAAKSGAAQEQYNDRVAQCAAAARLLGAPAGGLLADVPAERRQHAAQLEDPVLRARAGFVFAEAARVDQTVAALAAGDLERVGRLLDASHAGLRDEYEVSHAVVDELVERARAAGALGARIVGAGFGGSLIAVTRRPAVDRILADLGSAARLVHASAGAQREDLPAKW